LAFSIPVLKNNPILSEKQILIEKPENVLGGKPGIKEMIRILLKPVLTLIARPYFESYPQKIYS
jgi:hypothetical protein